MARNLGHLTAYGLEDIYDFIGEERMRGKIEEYKDKPTMGYKLDNYISSHYDFSSGSEKGPFHVMETFIYSWFEGDLDLALFLFSKSKQYTEENYLVLEPFKSLWEFKIKLSLERIEHLGDSSYITKEAFLKENINPYWVEYHFLNQYLASILMKYRTDQKANEVLLDLFERYLEDSDSLTNRMKLTESTWSPNGLGSTIYAHMEQFFYERNDRDKLEEIWHKADLQGWRVAFNYEDDLEDDED